MITQSSENVVVSSNDSPSEQTSGIKEWTEAASVQQIRVSVQMVDELIGQASELLAAQSRLAVLAGEMNHFEIHGLAETIEKAALRIRDSSFRMCLVPLETLTNRFQRLVRDLSLSLGKKIHFQVQGGDVELDKTILQNLTAPLLHLLRNSVDHGVELPSERMAAGKPEFGTIKIKAVTTGGAVQLTIEDDGGGINLEKVQKKSASFRLNQGKSAAYRAGINRIDFCARIFHR